MGALCGSLYLGYLHYQADSEIKEAFALFDKKGSGTIASENLGDLLRALGQNPTQAEVAELASSAPRESMYMKMAYMFSRLRYIH